MPKVIDKQTLSTVTSLRILIPVILFLVIFAIFLRRKQLKNQQVLMVKQTKIPINLILLILLGIYLLVYIHLTFTYRRPARQAKINLTPFWSYKAAFQIIPPKIKRLGMARQIFMNILLTVPPGLLLPLCYHKKKNPVVMTVVSILLLSVTTEAVQYFTRRGLCELDDIFDNLFGGLLGTAIMFFSSRMISTRKAELFQ